MKANETFTSLNEGENNKVLEGTLGTVREIDGDGDAKIHFQGIGRHWVPAQKLGKLSVLSVLSPEEQVSSFYFMLTYMLEDHLRPLA